MRKIESRPIKVMNLMLAGNVGGIEELCKNISKHASYDNVFCFIKGGGKIYDEMVRNGADVILCSQISKRKLSIRKLASLYALAKNCDVIVTHHCAKTVQLYYILLSYLLRRKKYVMTVHSCFEKQYNYPHKCNLLNLPEKFLLKKTIDRSDKVIFVSNAGKESYLREFNINLNKVQVVYNGVEVDGTVRVKTGSVKKDQYSITYIGRLETIKGVEILIEAVQRLCAERNVKLTIVGGGSCEKSLRDKVKFYGLSQNVSFEGIQRDREKYLRSTDIFIYPSICEEVFGISIVEALSYGVPSVAFSVGGIPEIINEGYNGALSEEKTVEGLKDAIVRIISVYESGQIEEMSRNCIESADRFSISNTVNQLQDIFEHL